MSDKLTGWKKTALATTVVWGLLGGHADALTLGRIAVLSSLGEPLRAEIEVSDVTAEEAVTLTANVASPEAFNAAGLHYNPVMPDVQVKLISQAGGRAVIGLSSQRQVGDPFIDLLIEATWAAGRIVRDYTLLFDPPSPQKTTPLPPIPAQVSEVARQPAAAPSPLTPEAATPPAPQPAASAPAEKAPKQATPAPQTKHLVKSGDTATAIALRNKLANVSLDQMLVALMRANPNAFVGDNVNRLKTGALITIPSAAIAQQESSTQASQILVAQSLDFREYRRKLAAAAPASSVLSADRKDSGTLQAKVKDNKLQAPAPDKLTLSKGSLQGKSAEATIAAELAAKDSADRAAELAKNISDLNKLAVTTQQAAPPPAPPSSAASPSAVSSIAPTLALASTPLASAAVAAAPAPKSSAAVASKASTDGLAGLIKNPYASVGALSLLLALLGFVFFRRQQRRRTHDAVLGDLAEPETLAASPQAALALVSASADAHDLVPEPAPTPQHPTEYREATDFRQKLAAVEAEQRGVDLDFDLDLNQQAAKQQQPNFPKPATLTESTDLALPDLDIFSAPEPTKTYPRLADFKPSAPALSPAPSAPELGALDFDLSSLSSLSRDSGEATRPAATDAGQDPLETKLALAHEFSAIGDEYGARALIEEVIAEATGAMKTKAERALRQRQAS